jgi:hypothetical protein
MNKPLLKSEPIYTPFDVTDLIGHHGVPKLVPGNERRVMFGDKVEAYWHRAVGVKTKVPLFLVDFRLLGKVVPQPWWFRQYKDMPEFFVKEIWNEPVNLSDFALKDGILHQGKIPLPVSLHGPRNILPYLLKVGVKQCRLFTFDDPFLNEKDRTLFMAGYTRSLGFVDLSKKK